MSLSFAAFLALAVPALAQTGGVQQPASEPKQGAAADPQADKSQTFVGCLMSAPVLSSAPGARPGEPSGQEPSPPADDAQGLRPPASAAPSAPASASRFVLKREGTGEEIFVEGLSQLSEHANHTVQLSGTLTPKDGRRVLTASAIKHMSPSCETKPGAAPSGQGSKPPASY
jgi:hypothetical protein